MSAETEKPEPKPGWLSDRLGWPGITSSLAAYRVPRRSFVFYLGGITLFLLLLQVASGILLVLYYRPDAGQAFQSVERIVGELPYGNLVRAAHVWASDLFVASLLIHLLTILHRRTFRAPRELSWLSGIVSAMLGIGLAFTGAILPWSQTAYTHARVGSELARYVPVVGGELHRFMRGGDEVTSATLGHAFGFHVAALPAAITLMVALHLFFHTRKPRGVASEPWAPRSEAPPGVDTIPLYPDFLVRQGAVFTAVLVVLMTLTVFIDRPLGVAADPRLASPVGALPPWYFLPAHQIISLAPKELLGFDGARFLVGAACSLGLVVIALPFIDRRGSKLTSLFAWIVLFLLILLSIRALY